jgi:hypothetical protein
MEIKRATMPYHWLLGFLLGVVGGMATGREGTDSSSGNPARFST